RVAFLKGDFNKALARIDLQISLHSDKVPSSYYVRGLIEGFMGDYESAARDYKIYLKGDPTNWAAGNDYAWVLLKADKPKEALEVIDSVIPFWKENPWL